MRPTQDKMVQVLRSGKIQLWNRFNGIIEYHANLGDANLRGANLRGANLGGVNLGGVNLRLYHSGRYVAYIQKEKTRIGCQYRSNEFWLNADIETISKMANDAREWWEQNGEIIKSIIKSIQKETI